MGIKRSSSTNRSRYIKVHFPKGWFCKMYRIWTILSSLVTLSIYADPSSRANCFWSSPNECLLDCWSGVIADVNQAVTNSWNERTQCHHDGMMLRLGSNIIYDMDLSIPCNFFNAEAPIVELTLDCNNIESIDDDAFVSPAFQTLQKLTLRNVHYNNLLTRDSLNGLYRLKELSFEMATFRSLRPGSLDAVADTIVALYFIESSRYDLKICIDNLTGGNPMHQLTKVKFQRNLRDTLTERSFIALVNVRLLDLSNCQIAVIAPRTFDPISNTILELNLSRNKIMHLPMGLLDSILIRPMISIDLWNNEWMCNCDLCYLKWIIQHGYFTDMFDFKCKSPFHLRDQYVIDVHLCADHTCDDYALENNTHSTTEPSIVHEPSYYFCDIDSSGIDYIPIQLSSFAMKFMITVNSTVAVLVESEIYPICNMVLVWFDSTRNMIRTPLMRCPNVQNRSTHFQQVIMINTLQANTPYVFCLMDVYDETVLPRNCMPYLNLVATPRDEDVWLWQKDKTVRIALMVLLMLGSVLGGFMVAYLMLRKHTRVLMEKKRIAYSGQSSFDANTDATDISSRPDRSASTGDGNVRTTRSGSVGSNASAQSYAMAVSISRFDIVQMQLSQKTLHNQRSLEEIPYSLAPKPPAKRTPLPIAIDLTSYVDKQELRINNKEVYEHIYSDIVSDGKF